MQSETANKRAKWLANLKARCALAGVVLVESTDDRGRTVYMASRWAVTKQLDSLEEVESWIARVDGVRVRIAEGVPA